MNRRTLGFAALLLVLVAAGAYAKKQKPTKAADEQKRALHALDRLTFGPRPGDVDAVAAMGVDKWIDLQLHPDRIDNAAMQAHLAPYRTLTMSTREMVMAFPPNPVAKAVIDGKLPMPNDVYRHAVYVAAIDRVAVKDQKKNEQQQPQQATIPAAAAAPDGMKPPDASAPTLANSAATLANSNLQPPDVQPVNAQPANVKPSDLAPKQGARKQAHLAVDDLIPLPPATRMQRILALPVAEQHDLLQGIPYPKRLALLNGLSPEQRETVIALNHPEAVIDSELQAGKLLRAVYSDRQLEEVLTDFWFNHFNVFVGKGADRYLVTSYERDVIRPHVLGKFKDMLIATAQSPAMLFYLDNWQSEGPNSDAALGKPAQANNPHPFAPRRPGALYPPPAQRPPQQQPQPAAQNQNQQKRRSGLNENYARELMELHTLGVNGGYTQHDVTEVARVFTGWTLDQPQQGGGFIYRPRLHEPGDKLVLGHHIKSGGENEGIEVLTLLSRQPATARFISTELAQRFVADTPPPALIDAMSKTFLKTDGDLREVIRTMFSSPEFWAPEAYRARVKTPFEFVVSSLRATQSDVTEPQALIYVLNKMGQPLFGSQPPTGYSTKSEVWVNSAALLDRMNFGLALATNKLQGTSFNLAQLMNTVPAPAASATAVSAATLTTSSLGDDDPYQVQLKLEQLLLAGDISKQTHDAIEQQIVGPQLAADSQTRNQPNVAVIAGLLLGSPEFQRK